MFGKILIANRGEIACRIIRSARRLGIKTVAVYSDADRDALHSRLADEAICIGPPAAIDSYLSMETILKACRESGAEAVHPGYGFLSENTAFAEALTKEGVTFIGPGPDAIQRMGDKIVSKKLAAEAGVNTIPGSNDVMESAEDAIKAARGIGYPVMLKACAGGGGKGMRIAEDDESCREGFARAAGEAASSFGDDRIMIEKYIEEPRHIEIQVLADRHGNIVHLGERECSLQRRHQKVIEEAPSPFLDESTRSAMGAQAVALARAVNYESAGTVEFIVDAGRNFYFLEMNTRLQVEHPVTELVTGLDLVELMIRIAAGEELPFGQDEVSFTGWAVEGRIYAEDPFRNFLPSTGRLVRYLSPAEENGVRVDTGVYEGGEVSVWYDPMIAKLICHGVDRDEARERLKGALDEFCIRGVKNNIGFLSSLINHPRFIEGRLSTNLIAEEYPDGFHPGDTPHDDPEIIVAIAASIHRRHLERDGNVNGQMEGYRRKVGDYWVVVLGDTNFELTVKCVDGGHDVVCRGRSYAVRSDWKLGEPLFRGTVDGRYFCLQVERRGICYHIMHGGSLSKTTVLSPLAAELNAFMLEVVPPDLSRFLLSPMPGLLVSVDVAPGQEVKAGEKLAVVEAMKMENALLAERDCVVASLHAAPGDSLAVDQSIMEFE